MTQKDYICDVCNLNFLENGMIFTGSKDEFRYRIKPDMENRKLKISVYMTYCYECAKDIINNEFDISAEGYLNLRKWIDDEYKEHLKH